MTTSKYLSLENAAQIIKETTNRKNDNDFIVLVSGARGIGKSVLAMKLAYKLIGESYFSEEGFDKYNIYQRKEFKDKLENFDYEEPLIVDEAINILFKREFQNKQQNSIIKMFNTHRDMRRPIFLLLPHFWDLDSAVRNSLIVKWWIHCYNRGQAIIFTHDDNPGSFDPWNRKFIWEYWSKKRPWAVSNYVAHIRWSNIPDHIYDIYKGVKKRKRLVADQELKKEKITPKRHTIIAIKHYNPNATGADIAKWTGISKNYVYETLASPTSHV